MGRGRDQGVDGRLRQPVVAVGIQLERDGVLLPAQLLSVPVDTTFPGEGGLGEMASASSMTSKNGKPALGLEGVIVLWGHNGRMSADVEAVRDALEDVQCALDLRWAEEAVAVDSMSTTSSVW